MVFAIGRFFFILFFRSLGRLFFYLFKKRRRVSRENVEKCYSFVFAQKPHSQGRTRRLVKKSFAGLGHNLADFLLLPWYTSKNVDRYVATVNISHLENACAKEKGVIISTAHFGSWELAAHYLALKGYKSLIVYNKFKKPEGLDAWVKRRREGSGNRLIIKQNSFLSLYKQLRKGGVITLVTDQHAFPPEGRQVPFLGIDAWTHTTFVKMSIKTGAPIVPVFMHRNGSARYTIEFQKPIDPKNFVDDPEAVYKMTCACNQALEHAIRKAPDLWMWQHRRFKSLNPR